MLDVSFPHWKSGHSSRRWTKGCFSGWNSCLACLLLAVLLEEKFLQRSNVDLDIQGRIWQNFCKEMWVFGGFASHTSQITKTKQTMVIKRQFAVWKLHDVSLDRMDNVVRRWVKNVSSVFVFVYFFVPSCLQVVVVMSSPMAGSAASSSKDRPASRTSFIPELQSMM